MSFFSQTKTKAEYEAELEDERRAQLPVKEQCRLLWNDIKTKLVATRKENAESLKRGKEAAQTGDGSVLMMSDKSFVWTKRLILITIAIFVCGWSLTRLSPAIDEEEIHEEQRYSKLCQVPGNTCPKTEATEIKAVMAPKDRDPLIFPTAEK